MLAAWAPHNELRLASALLLALAFAAGCSCSADPRLPPPGGSGWDGGEEAPVDAGCPGCSSRDAGAPDASDAGVVVRIGSIAPQRAPASGGADVTLEGTGFYRGFASGAIEAKKDTRLFFGDEPVGSFRIIDDSTLELVVPPHVRGAVDVVIENPSGRDVCRECFTYFAQLAVTGVSPQAGAETGGTEIVVAGDGFDPPPVVLIGGRSSPRVTRVDEHSLRAVVPPASASGLVDVKVFNKNGLGELRGGFRYQPVPELRALEPTALPLGGGSLVLRGRSLAAVERVTVGGEPAPFTVEQDGGLRVAAPPAAVAGLVDLSVAWSAGVSTLPRGLVYFDPAATALLVAGVAPRHGPPEGGAHTTIAGAGFLDGARVLFGAAEAPSVTVASPQLLEVEVPPGPAGSDVPIQVVLADGSTATAGSYHYNLSVAATEPSQGPVEGGTLVRLTGSGFPAAGVQVSFGGLAASEVTVRAPATLEARTPASPEGVAELRVVSTADPLDQSVLAAAFRFVEPLSIARLAPESGSVSGGLWVTVMGTGFAPGVVVTFGGSPLRDLQILDGHTVVGRTPPGSVGAVDLAVALGAQADSAPGAFTYVDPRNTGGGSSGPLLRGTLNVTVLEGGSRALPGALVALGDDPTTPLQGRTDSRGQITFSDPRLVKPQVVTVSKPDYQTVTIAGQPAENLTVFLPLASGSSGGGDPGLPPELGDAQPTTALISGRVTGFKLPRPLGPTEQAVAEVWIAPTSLYNTPPFGWMASPADRDARGERWRVYWDGGPYTLITGRGLKALYAVFGILDTATDVFTPLLMGLRRGVYATPDEPVAGADIALDMHLDLATPVTVLNPLFDGLHQPSLNEVYGWLELGAEGVIPVGKVEATRATMSLEGLPRLDGDSFVFLNRASLAGRSPESYAFRRQRGDLSTGLQIGPMLDYARFDRPQPGESFDGTLAWAFDGGSEPDLVRFSLQHSGAAGYDSPWVAYLPGTARTVTLPAPVLERIRSRYRPGEWLFVEALAVRSPRFDFSNWSYSHLSLDAQTAWSTGGVNLSLSP